MVWLQLAELERARKKLTDYDDWIAKQQELVKQQQEVWNQAIVNAKEATRIAEQQRDLEKEKAEFYKSAYEAVTKKRGIGCFFKKVFTFGRSKCK